MIIKIEMPCESCSTLRKFKYSTTTEKIYGYKPVCKKCTLTERNKKQNFSPRTYPIVDMFEKIDTQEKAYIYGFLWADGYMKFQKRATRKSIKSLEMNLNYRDVEVLDFIVKHFGGAYQERSVPDKRTGKCYDMVQWQLNSKDVYDNFFKLGFRNHSNAVPDELFYHFLRGLIDGDGYIRMRGNSIEIKISSNYEQDWSYISDRIKNPSHVSRYIGEKSRSSDLYIKGDRRDILRELYKDASFYLKRKYNIIREVIENE